VKYPGLTHINKLKHHKAAVFSLRARKAHRNGSRVVIEHVSPLRALTQRTIERVLAGNSDDKLIAYVKRHYRLALLTPDEMAGLNKLNRSKMDARRLERGNIKLQARFTR
jgi:hypothetical protein